MTTKINCSRISSFCIGWEFFERKSKGPSNRLFRTNVSSRCDSSPRSPRSPRSRTTPKRAFRFSHETRNVGNFSISQENRFDLRSKPGSFRKKTPESRLIAANPVMCVSSQLAAWFLPLGKRRQSKNDMHPMMHVTLRVAFIDHAWHVESCLYRPKSK